MSALRLRRRSAARLVWIALASTVVASCGLPADSHPRPIKDKAITDLVSPPPNATAVAPNAAGTKATVYFVRGDRLVPTPVPTKSAITVDDVLTLLLDGPPGPAAPRDLTTSIPAGTVVRSTHFSRGTLSIDLSGNIKAIGGSAAKTAYAQLVFTATELSKVKQVKFSVSGDAVDAPTDDGALEVIKRSNYRPPLSPG